jgi:esterase/lipase superfamily enzyme
LQQSLAALPVPFRGVLVSFDWPCDRHVLAYLTDRHRAKLSALRLVNDGIRSLAARQRTDCALNVHVLGHSTGAYLIREAFDDADDARLANGSWNVSQVLFVAADVSAASLDGGCASSESLYRHCVRLTNYHSRLDAVLDLSGVKRLGLAPRAGRVGLTPRAPDQAVDVDCTAYFHALRANAQLRARDQPDGFVGDHSHSWYFGNRRFADDLAATLTGVDRLSNPARTRSTQGTLQLASD